MIKKLFTLLALAFCLNGKAQCTLTATITSTNASSCGASNGSATIAESGGAGGYTYTWSPIGGTYATAYNLLAGTYTCIVEDALGCIATATVAVNQPPTVNVIVNTAGNNYNLTTTGADTIPACTGTTLDAYTAGVTNFTWMPGGYTTDTITAPTTPTNYTLTATSGTCITTYTFTTKINPPLTHSVSYINPPMNPIYCTGIDTLAAYPSYYGETYTWLPAAEVAPGYFAYFAVATCTSTTTYSVTNSMGGCIGGTAVLTLTVNPAPTVTYTLVADTAPHTWDAYPTYPAGATSYEWNWGDGSQSYTAYPSHTYSVAGTYSICVTVSEGYGCTATYCQNDAVSRLGNNSPLSSMVYVNVLNSHTTGINQITNSNELNIYPNPNNGSFVIEPSGAAKQTMQVYDVNGKLVLSQTITGKTSIDASSLNEGVYNISLQSNEGVVNNRIVIVK